MSKGKARALVDSLFESWYSCVLRYACRLTRDLEAAEDVVQGAFLLLYEQLRFGAGVENPKGWVLTVVRRRCFQYLEAVRTGPEFFAPEKMAEFAEDTATDPFSRRLLTVDACKLMNVLTPREEEVVLLRLASLKYREIAAELGISSSAVNTLLARAVRKLQVAASASGVEPATNQTDQKDASFPKTLQ